MQLKTSFEFDFKAKSINPHTKESTVYVTHIDCNNTSIACTGNGFIKLYDINNGKVNSVLRTNHIELSDMTFCPRVPHLLLTSSQNDGVIDIYDIRAKHNDSPSQTSSSAMHKLPSPHKSNKRLFSVCMDKNLIAGAGPKDSYVWDLRKLSTTHTLAQFHTEEVTKVKFNPTSAFGVDRHLFSASEDTLINEYDLGQLTSGDADEALINTYECEQTLWNFGFFSGQRRNQKQKRKHAQQFVYCLTNDESLIVQELDAVDKDGGDAKQNDDDEDMEMDMQERQVCTLKSDDLDHLTLIDCFYDYAHLKQLCLLSCSINGKLRLSAVDGRNVKVLSESKSGHQARVRCACYVESIGCFFTGGEDNKVAMWKFDPVNIQPQLIEETSTSNTIHMNDEILMGGYAATRAPANDSSKTDKATFKPY